MLGIVKKPKSTRRMKIITRQPLEQHNADKTYVAEPDEELISDNGTETGYWVMKGEDYWMNSNGSEIDAKKAIEFFDKAIELNPFNYIAWMNKGLIFKKVSKHEEAILCYDRAISIKPKYPNSWINKGVLLGGLGKIQAAIKCFNKVLEIAPDNKLARKDKNMLMEVMKYRQCSKVKVRAIKAGI